MPVTTGTSPYHGALRMCIMAYTLIRNMPRHLDATEASQRSNGATQFASINLMYHASKRLFNSHALVPSAIRVHQKLT